MNLVSFSVRHYRSIVKAERLPLGNLTVIIGPNNEGKSNILRALVVGMQILSEVRTSGIRRGRFRGDVDAGYVWERDFPVAQQKTSPLGDSEFDFEFLLDPQETADFAREVKSSLNGTLPISIALGPTRTLFRVTKKGPGAKALTDKRDQIVAFLSKRLQLQYVAAVRTAEQAVMVVQDLVDSELAAIEADADYRQALAKIGDLQKPILDSLSQTLSSTLQGFLPEVKSVVIDVPNEARSLALRRDVRVTVDDGVPTELRQKGDGVQSLAALSLIRHASLDPKAARQQILAVEEPEVHLHPAAIHQLKRVLAEIAAHQQVILTTHCPLLVNRRDVGSNIIVESNRARRAKSVREIREVLGVRTADNLIGADVVLIVEGTSDRTALISLLGHHSSELDQALESGRLSIESLAGGSNLSYRLEQLRDSLCLSHAFLDNDQTGISAARKAIDLGLMLPADQTLTVVPGVGEAEIEDLYEPGVYTDVLKDRWNVDVTQSQVRRIKRNAKRLRRAFDLAGQPWSDETEAAAKQAIAVAVASAPDRALVEGRRGPFDTLVLALEEKLRSSEP